MSWLRDVIERIENAHKQHCNRVEEKLDAILERINQVEKNMSQELKDAVARITASAQRLINDAVTKLSQPDPDVAGAITALNAASDAMDTESGSLEGSAGATGATGSGSPPTP